MVQNVFEAYQSDEIVLTPRETSRLTARESFESPPLTSSEASSKNDISVFFLKFKAPETHQVIYDDIFAMDMYELENVICDCRHDYLFNTVYTLSAGMRRD